MSKTILLMTKTQNKQNNLLTNPQLHLVKEYLRPLSRHKYYSKTTPNRPQALKRQKQNDEQKTRPPYATWTREKSQKQDDPEQK